MPCSNVGIMLINLVFRIKLNSATVGIGRITFGKEDSISI